MTQAVLFDTSVYIAALRQPQALDLRAIRSGRRLWMSAVVVEELYAGARGREIRMIELLERSFTVAERMLVPDLNDWKQAGLLLARIAEKYGYDQIGRGRLTNDALLAVSSLRPKATVVTMNQRDFARLAEFGQFNWEPVPSNPKP